MPWCERCSRFWNPNSVGVDGTCPSCGRPLPAPAAVVRVADPAPADRPSPASADAGPDDDVKAPWHFKLLVAVTVVYLAWRAVEMIGWVVN